MVDSSKWEVIEAGLKCLQGKGIVNSISLKEGEEKFRAARAHGPASTAPRSSSWPSTSRARPRRYDDKIRICERAYRILVDEVGFPPEDIIFDPNILTVAHRHGGAQQLRRRLHRGHALDQGTTCRTPRSAAACRTSPSASAATTTCARRCTRRSSITPSRAGMDMGIVNAGMLEVYEEIEPELRELVEDVLLNRRPDATERLVDFGEKLKAAGAGATGDREEGRGVAQAARSRSASRTRWSRASTRTSTPTPKRRAPSSAARSRSSKAR